MVKAFPTDMFPINVTSSGRREGRHGPQRVLLCWLCFSVQNQRSALPSPQGTIVYCYVTDNDIIARTTYIDPPIQSVPLMSQVDKRSVPGTNFPVARIREKIVLGIDFC